MTFVKLISMDVEEYRKKIELEILQIIEQKLKQGEMSEGRAREIARFILDALHPHMEIEQIRKVIQGFDKHFPELMPVILQTANDYDQQIKKLIGNYVVQLLKQNKVGEADDILDKALNKRVL